MPRTKLRVVMLALVVLALVSWWQLAARSPQRTSAGVAYNEVVRASNAWDGSPLPAYPQGRPELTVERLTIPPRERAALPYPVVPAVGVALDGALAVYREDSSFRVLGEGQAFALVESGQYVENRGRAPVNVLVFYAGAEGMTLARSE